MDYELEQAIKHLSNYLGSKLFNASNSINQISTTLDQMANSLSSLSYTMAKIQEESEVTLRQTTVLALVASHERLQQELDATKAELRRLTETSEKQAYSPQKDTYG